MLPNETCLEVFRWLDRRVIEAKLQLVSRRANALVQLLASRPTYILIESATVTAFSDNYIEFNLLFYRPLNSSYPSQPQRRPFDVYEPGSVPGYILVRKLSMSECGMEKFPDRTDKEDHVLHSSISHVRRMKRDSVYLQFTARHEQGNNALFSLYDNCWNCLTLSAQLTRPHHFGARMFRTTLRVEIESMRSEIVAPIADWLATPAQLNVQTRKTFDGGWTALTDVKRLQRILKEQFTYSTSPSSYELRCYIGGRNGHLKCEAYQRADRPGEILCAHYCNKFELECWRGPVESLPKWEKCKQITTQIL